MSKSIELNEEVKVLAVPSPKLSTLLGKIGVVKGIKEVKSESDKTTTLYAVEFDEKTKLDNLWNCNGLVPSGNGWFFISDQLISKNNGKPEEDEVKIEVVPRPTFLCYIVTKICEFSAKNLEDYFTLGSIDDEDVEPFIDAFISNPELLEHSDDILGVRVYEKSYNPNGEDILYWEIIKKKKLVESSQLSIC